MTHGDVVAGFIEALLDDDAQSLYEKAPCGYLSTTPDGTIVKANETFLNLTGHHRTDLVGRKRFVDLLTGGGRIYHETHYAPMLRMEGVAREIALELVCADGSRLPVLVNSVLERDSAGNAVVIRTAVFDASHRRQYEAELLRAKQRSTALARTLQQTLIPPQVPEIEGLVLSAAYRPAGHGDEVGGDFYDIFPAARDEWWVVIGDVCGKGAEAAVVTAQARYTLRAAAVQSPSPAAALALLNDALIRAEVERFCTALMLRFRRTASGWRLSCCAAGHPLPLHVGSDGVVTPVGSPGTLLGVTTELNLADTQLDLGPGELVAGYTDGVTEARSGDGSFYGEDRLRAQLPLLATNPSSVARELLADVLRFQKQVARDDIAVVTCAVPMR